MSDAVRIGYVSKVNYEDGTVEVTYADRDNTVTSEINMLSNGEYKMPKVGQLVAVFHNGNGAEMGSTIGTIWNDDNKPPEGKEGLYRKDYNDEYGQAYERYDGKIREYQKHLNGDAIYTIGGDMLFKVGGATVRVCQSGAVEITGTTISIKGSTVSIDAGTMNITGGAGDCEISGISLVKHKHIYTVPLHANGTAPTEKPQ